MKENCNICNGLVTVNFHDYGMDSRYTYDCKCGNFLADEFTKRQKYAKLVNKYHDKPELLIEILCDLKCD